VRCIIGEARSNDGNDIRFFINDKFDETNPNNFNDGMFSKVTKFENVGISKVLVRSKINSTVQLAIQKSSEEKVSLDSTEKPLSYLIQSYQEAGIPIKSAENYNGDYDKVLVDSGFTWVAGDRDQEELRRGDILITKNNNMMMYAGDGELLIDYNTLDFTTDEEGNPVPVFDSKDITLKGIYRYGKVDVVQTQGQQAPAGTQQPGQPQQPQEPQQPQQPTQPQGGEGPVGPNGEQPGQVGPNGEQPPDGPPAQTA